MADQELAGRVAVITGAGRSIGRAMALELAAGGCAVVVNVRSNRAEAEARRQGDRRQGRQGDGRASPMSPTRPRSRPWREAALKKFGRIDYLINNAALRQEKAIEHMTFEDWRFITGVILDGAFHCVKACLGAIKKSDAGSIINVGGLTGAMGAPDRAHVVTAKAGIAGFTRALAMELAPHKITVNTIVPSMLARPDKPNEIPAHPVYRPLLGPRRLAGRHRAARALPGGAGRALHHRPDHQRQRRDVFQRLTGRPRETAADDAIASDLDCRHRGHSRPADRFGDARPAGAGRGAGIHRGVRLGPEPGSAISPRRASSARCSC